MSAKPADSCTRRVLVGPSFGATLASNSDLPVLYVPSAKLAASAQACSSPATLLAVQAELLAQQPAAWQQSTASAA